MPGIIINNLANELQFTEYHRRRGELRDSLRHGVYPNPTSGTQARIYMKGDKLIVQYNDTGTIRYKYLALNNTSTTWTHTTTAP